MKKIFTTVLSAGLLLGTAACAPTALQQAEETGERLMKLMPALVIPEGAEPLGGGGGGSETSLGSGATFRSELSLDEVYQHYVAQLSAADWRLISEQSSGTTVTSWWQVTDEDGSLLDGKLDVTFGSPDFADAYTVNVNLALP